MKITASDTAQTPIYRQIYDQLVAQILSGELPPGSALPPIRTVASELRISVISVKRAWEELTRDGYITTAVGRGSFVAELKPHDNRRLRREALADKLAPGVRACRALGADLAEITAVVEELFAGEQE